MKKLLKETTIRDFLSNVSVGDNIKIIADKEYNLTVIKKESSNLYMKLGDSIYIFKKNALQDKTLYYSKLINNQGTANGKIENVKTITNIRGYDVISTVTTSTPEITKERLDFLKETNIDIKSELQKLKVDDRVTFEMARLKKPENEEDDEMIDESTITKLTLDVIGVPKEGYLKCKTISLKGNDLDKYEDIKNGEFFMNKSGILFNEKEGSSLLLRDIITKHDTKITNIVNIDIIDGGAEKIEANKNPNGKIKNKYYTDREIYNIVRNDPTMSQALTSRKGFLDFLLGHTHNEDKDKTIRTLRNIKAELNKNNYKKRKKSNINKTYSIIFNSDTITTDPSFHLTNGEKYTVKVIHSSEKGTRLAIYPYNNTSQKRILYTMDIPGSIRKGKNNGKIYYGGKSDEKTRQFIGNGEITIQ